MFGKRYRLVRPPALAFSNNLNSPTVKTPVGSVVAWNAASNRKDAKDRKVDLPETWALLDGREYYPWQKWKLFKTLGYKYGRNGLKFKLPDWRGHLMTKLKPNYGCHNPTNNWLYFYYVMKVE
jgi:hypothetical protein